MQPASRLYGGEQVDARRARRREQFLQAGIATFGERGYTDTKISDICAAAGLARSQFYESFGSREDFLLAVYDVIQTDARRAVADAVATSTESADIAERITKAIAAYVDSIGTDPRRAAISFVVIVGVSPRVERHRIDQREEWVRFFETAMRDGVGADFTPRGGYELVATGFIGALMALVHRWSVAQPRPAIGELSDVLVGFLLGSITQRP